MSPSPVRWGILGTAQIARKNWQALRDAGNARLVAVASRHLARAQTFVAECQSAAPHETAPEALGSYDELLSRTDIDAVYLPLPTVPREDWALKAAAHRKHLLLEKPVASNAARAEAIIAACSAQNLQFMDGVMFMHSQRMRLLSKHLRESVGTPKTLCSQFSFPAGEDFLKTNIRTQLDAEPLGCLGDLGWYNIRLALHLAGESLPTQVRGKILNAHPQSVVPLSFSGELLFETGFLSTFHCSFEAANAQWAVLTGTSATLTIPDFVLPFANTPPHTIIRKSEFITADCEFAYDENASTRAFSEPSNNAPGSQESAMFKEFSRLVLARKPDPFWPASSLATQQILDACLQSARTTENWIALPK